MKVYAQVIKDGDKFYLNQFGDKEFVEDNVVFEFDLDNRLIGASLKKKEMIDLKALRAQAEIKNENLNVLLGKSALINLLDSIDAADNLIESLHANEVYYKFWFPMDAYMRLRGTLPADHHENKK